MDQNLKKSIILEHYQNPKNRGLIDNNSYIKINMNNESCIDEINLMVKIDDDVITDIRFDGEACAISTSSTSIMIDTLIGKTLDEAKNIIDNYSLYYKYAALPRAKGLLGLWECCVRYLSIFK